MEEQLGSGDILTQIPPKTILLVPPVPLCRPSAGDSANWPLLMSTWLGLRLWITWHVHSIKPTHLYTSTFL